MKDFICKVYISIFFDIFSDMVLKSKSNGIPDGRPSINTAPKVETNMKKGFWSQILGSSMLSLMIFALPTLTGVRKFSESDKGMRMSEEDVTLE